MSSAQHLRNALALHDDLRRGVEDRDPVAQVQIRCARDREGQADQMWPDLDRQAKLNELVEKDPVADLDGGRWLGEPSTALNCQL